MHTEKVDFLPAETKNKWCFTDIKLKKTETELYLLSFKADCHAWRPGPRSLYLAGANIVIVLSPFQKTLPRLSAFVNWISVRFYETVCFRNFLRGVKGLLEV